VFCSKDVVIWNDDDVVVFSLLISLSLYSFLASLSPPLSLFSFTLHTLQYDIAITTTRGVFAFPSMLKQLSIFFLFLAKTPSLCSDHESFFNKFSNQTTQLKHFVALHTSNQINMSRLFAVLLLVAMVVAMAAAVPGPSPYPRAAPEAAPIANPQYFYGGYYYG